MGRFTYLLWTAVGAAATAVTAYYTRSYLLLIPAAILTVISIISGLIKVCDQRGMTLIELIVVVAIVLALMAMVSLPAH
jgi:prepilin-type N-terminal cleavage/methylation domain-containing protein